MEEVLLNVMYELPSREDVTKCVIDEKVVLEKVNPTLVPREVKEKASRQPKERSA
jgi:ATP-dependent Clp protease ATP-binding subunit ClpX